MLLQCLSAAGAEVRVGTAHRMLVPTMQHLRDTCGASGDYDACTRFVAWQLNATCASDSDGWRMRASATFTPWIVLYNIEQLSHELDHVGDVRRSAEQYVDELEHERFASPEECRQRTIQEAGSFEETIRRFASESNAVRHPLVYAHASGR